MSHDAPSGSSPDRVNSSVWHKPVALISTKTSPAFGPARSTSTISSGLPAPNATAARVFSSASRVSTHPNYMVSVGPLVGDSRETGKLLIKLFFRPPFSFGSTMTHFGSPWVQSEGRSWRRPRPHQSSLFHRRPRVRLDQRAARLRGRNSCKLDDGMCVRCCLGIDVSLVDMFAHMGSTGCDLRNAIVFLDELCGPLRLCALCVKKQVQRAQRRSGRGGVHCTKTKTSNARTLQ